MNRRGPERDTPPLLVWAAGISWRFLAVAAALAVGAFLVSRLTLVIVPALVALLVASVLHPPTDRLVEKRIPPSVAVLLVFAAVVGLIVGLTALIAPAVAGEIGNLTETLSAAEGDLAQWLEDEPLGLSRDDVDRYIGQLGEQISANGARIAGGVLGAAAGVVEIIAATALGLVLAFFFVKDRDQIWRWFVDQVPEHRRGDVFEAGRRAWETMQGYVRGITIIAFVDAVLIGTALAVLRIPLALPLSVLVFFGAFVPIIGAFTSGLVAVAVALVTRGVAEAAIVTVAITAIQQLEGNVLEPIVMGRTVKLHPVVVLLTVASGLIVAGVAGAFLAVPIVATASTAGGFLKEQRQARGKPRTHTSV